MRYKINFILMVCCVACSSNYKTPKIEVKITQNHISVKFKGLDYAILSEINRESALNKWQSLIPVYKMPADTELKNYQPPQPGKYSVADSSLVFTPDTPFVKGQEYFLRYYKFGQDESSWDLIKGTKKPGTAKFTDFDFTD